MTNCAGLSDKRAYLQVLGCLLQNPMLMDDVDMPLETTDFDTEQFYKIIFVAIYNLFQQGVENIDEYAIDSYLSNYSKEYDIFQSNKGLEWIVDAKDMSSLENYSYYYHRVKKFSLLRYYEKNGLDTTPIYDLTKSDTNEENDKFDKLTEQSIVDRIETAFVIEPKAHYCSMQDVEASQAGAGLDDIIDGYLQTPDYGYSMCSLAMNTICRGLRVGLYLRSEHSNIGKTRTFAMDVANFSIPYKYNHETKKFDYTGHSTPTLYINTEDGLKKVKRIISSCVSGVDDKHILEGKYEKGELERVRKANEYIKSAPLDLVYYSDFTIEDIENIIKKYVLQKGVKIVVFDYVQMTSKMWASKNRMEHEYQAILEACRRLKQLSEKLNIAILSGLQLKPDSKDAKYKDETCLQSAKAVVQKADVNIIMSKPNNAEKQKIEKITRNMMGCPEINFLQWCSKVRDGSLVSVIVCSHLDLGTFTIKDVFVTDYDFNLLPLEFTKIEEIKEEEVEQIVKENSREMIITEDEDIENEDTETDNTKYDFNW